MLRDLDLNRQNCNIPPEDQNVNKIPLTNEHGDIFHRSNDYDDCGPTSGEGNYEDFPPNQQYYNNQRPSPVESDYFYDQYVDYPMNETLSNVLNNSVGRFNQTAPYVDFNQNKFTQTHLLPPSRPPPSSQFTFFGHPLPSLTLGNVWGQGRTANNRATSGENTSRGKGRVQIFRPGDPALQVISNRPTNDLEVLDIKNREPAESVKNPVVDSSLEKMDEKFYRPYPYFQTPFSSPKTEKGFSPLIPGMTVGGFIPIQDPSKNETKLNPEVLDWPNDDDNLREVHLVTRSESQTKRASTQSSMSHIDGFGSSTVSHLATSLSPILSTLGPRIETTTTEKTVVEEASEEGEVEEDDEESSPEIEPRNPMRASLEEEVFKRNNEFTQFQTHPSTPIVTSTTESVIESLIETENGEMSMPLPSQTTTESEPVRESIESVDENFENFNGSSSLSADHLIAPGSILNQDVLSKPAALLPKAGKITKVFTTVPPSNSQEISKLLNPFYTKQHSTEPPITYDNESQPNQVYAQRFNENDRISEAPQYEREDMDWYFTNYNQSQSNPILNYNLQPYDNYEQSSAGQLNFNCISSAIVLFVIRVFLS